MCVIYISILLEVLSVILWALHCPSPQWSSPPPTHTHSCGWVLVCIVWIRDVIHAFLDHFLCSHYHSNRRAGPRSWLCRPSRQTPTWPRCWAPVRLVTWSVWVWPSPRSPLPAPMNSSSYPPSDTSTSGQHRSVAAASTVHAGNMCGATLHTLSKAFQSWGKWSAIFKALKHSEQWVMLLRSMRVCEFWVHLSVWQNQTFPDFESSQLGSFLLWLMWIIIMRLKNKNKIHLSFEMEGVQE